ncbi:MAG: tyrosine-type recombinase/integrase [Labrys sp. (in: a-proteobacteria)]
MEPGGPRKAAEIQPDDVDRLLRQIAGGTPGKRGRKPTPVRANRLGEILRKMFNLSVRWRIRADNPAAGFARNAEAPRDRYLSTDELGRLSAALDAHPNRRAADAVRLILLTGARRGEVLNARWDQFDLDAAVWIKPAATTKQRRLHRAPISVSAAALLRTIRLRVPEECEWVFPGEAEGKPLQDIKRFWEDVRAKADLPAVRIHDLRHTFASLLVSGGMTLPMIGKLLGHTQVQTTQRYAHLLDDPLRAGLEQVGDMLRAKPRLVGIEAA